MIRKKEKDFKPAWSPSSSSCPPSPVEEGYQAGSVQNNVTNMVVFVIAQSSTKCKRSSHFHSSSVFKIISRSTRYHKELLSEPII